jgi:predicted RNase H-like HicB family nuclease
MESETMNVKYAVVFEKAKRNWSAYVPDLPGCISTGKTLDDTKRNIREAIEFHIEGLRLVGQPVPLPSSVVEEVEVADVAA